MSDIVIKNNRRKESEEKSELLEAFKSSRPMFSSDAKAVAYFRTKLNELYAK